MDFVLFTKALVAGFAIAAPVGPIGLLCVQRTLTSGAKTGFACGLGAATADAIYGAIGAFGLTAVTHLFTTLSKPLALVGGLFLAWMGLQLLLKKAKGPVAATSSSKTDLQAFISTLALTLANPMTILSFIAVFAVLSESAILASGSARVMVLAIFLGSSIWWLTLTTSVSLIRHRIDTSMMKWINRAAGFFLLGFAAWQLGGLTL